MTEITRESIDAAIAKEDWPVAIAGLRTFYGANPGLANAQYVLGKIDNIKAGSPPTACRIAILRSFTVEPVVPLLRAAAALYGIDVEVRVGEFNTYAQDILTPGSALYGFDPHIVILAVQTRDLLPDIWTHFPDLAPGDAEALIGQAVRDLIGLIGAFRGQSQAHLVIHNLESPAIPANGILDAQDPCGQIETVREFNRALQQVASEHPGIYILDYDGLISRFGRDRWHDERRWLTARLPIAADCLHHLADAWLSYVIPLMGKGSKALVVDLDNTLWGGVIGEDGLTGIQLGPEFPGAAYQNLQRAVLELAQRGVILAVCSKNNLADAMEALESHPHMLLRPNHFACLRINWQDKAQNLREIAAELNIGIDSLAFLDDNPIERQRIQTELPEVCVIDLADDPMSYAAALRDCPVFERLSLSSEDRERGRFYAEQRQRTELQESAGTLEDFYRSLQMVAEIAPVTPQTLARTAQLTQKTNQFNLTTRRYTEQQIADMADDPAWRVYTLSVKDRFGDNGLVGMSIVSVQGGSWELDTFLMSCRVIGRTIETAAVAAICDEALRAGAGLIRGWFLPTKKNTPAKDFYSLHGFTVVGEIAEGTLWELILTDQRPRCPEWIDCRIHTNTEEG